MANSSAARPAQNDAGPPQVEPDRPAEPEAAALASRLADLTGETPEEAIRVSLAERLARERLRRGQAASVADELEAIVRRFWALPTVDPRSADEIIGYDEHGLPGRW